MDICEYAEKAHASRKVAREINLRNRRNLRFFSAAKDLFVVVLTVVSRCGQYSSLIVPGTLVG